MNAPTHDDRRAVAIVGMGCRFPDAPTPLALWRNTLERRASFKDIPADRWTHGPFHSDGRDPNATPCGVAAFVDDVTEFAARHFGFSPRRAQATDAQQRLILEVAREAIIDAGHESRPLNGRQSAAFVGVGVSEYSRMMVMGTRIRQLRVGDFGDAASDADRLANRVIMGRSYTIPGSLLSMCASLIAQTFDFGGPCVVVDAACAASLVAVVQGVQHLRGLPERVPGAPAPIVLAGGVYLQLLPDNIVGFTRVGALARSACRPFDRAAEGFLLGEGAGLLALKRLDDAHADGDRIYAVIRGVSWNSDGRSDSPMTPKLSGQIELLRAGFADAALAPSTIGYIEAHGTGTPVGDRAELQALDEVYAGVIERPRLGSVKANIGHALSAAGVAGLMRAAMACYTATLPPQAGWDAWADSVEPDLRFPIETSPVPWSGDVRRATVSAFGFGGLNAFAVLESERVPRTPEVPATPLLFCASAPTPALLDAYLDELSQALTRVEVGMLASAAFTLSVTRALSRYAAVFVAQGREQVVECIAALRKALAEPPQALTRVGLSALLGPVATAVPPCAEREGCECAAAVAGHDASAALLRRGTAHVLRHSVDLSALWPEAARRIADLPIAGLERERYWAVAPRPAEEAAPISLAIGTPQSNPPSVAGPSVATPPPSATDGTCEQQTPAPAPEASTETIQAIIARIAVRPLSSVGPEHRLVADLGFDSLMLAELAAHLARKHGVQASYGFWARDPRIDQITALVNASGSLASDAALNFVADATPGRTFDVTEENSRIEAFPEVRALASRSAAWGDLNPYFQAHDGVAGASITIDGRPRIAFTHYDYLGLNGHAEVSAAAREAIEQHGTTTGASRVVAGEVALHRTLERELADFLGVDDCVAFVSGHATNVSVISALVGPGDLVLHDALAHDSIIQGAVASRAARRAFPHNDVAALEQIVAKMRSSFRRVLVVTEGVFSMDGDVPDLPALIAMKERHGCLLMVDEAHALGVLGDTGRGLAEHWGVSPRSVEVWMGTFSKALASCGGYVAGSHALVHLLKHAASGFVYSVGMAPATAAAALAALRVLRREPARVARLRERSSQLARALADSGCDVGQPAGTPVIPLVLGDDMRCLHVTAALAAEGVHVMPIVYPAVAREASRLRFFVTAGHTPEQISRAAAVIGRVVASVPLPRGDTPNP